MSLDYIALFEEVRVEVVADARIESAERTAASRPENSGMREMDERTIAGLRRHRDSVIEFHERDRQPPSDVDPAYDLRAREVFAARYPEFRQSMLDRATAVTATAQTSWDGGLPYCVLTIDRWMWFSTSEPPGDPKSYAHAYAAEVEGTHALAQAASIGWELLSYTWGDPQVLIFRRP